MEPATLTHARLYVECTQTRSGPHYTGIQRYVRRTLAHARELLGDADAQPLVAEQGTWLAYASLAPHAMEGRPCAGDGGSGALAPQFSPRSHVLLADRFWHTQDWAALNHLLASRAQISVVVYDLLSLREPQWFSPGVGDRFGRYLRTVLPRASVVVCLSHRVRQDLQAWTREQGIACPVPRVVAPGHVAWEGKPSAPATLPADWRSGGRAFVLQVGTLEPRKNHALTLAAMQQLWARGHDVGCLFLGQPGWLTADWAASLRELPQWGGLLQWLPECSDPQLQWCYEHARAVVYPSAAEGYGLPLAEAATAGVPVIATDTAVHREVAANVGAASSRVRWCTAKPEPLADVLESMLQAPAPTARRGDIPMRDWHKATAELLEAVGVQPAALHIS